ncbi:unnamed protein product [Onchocerca ochengi]|uniref:Uncharacterized protein n=1 Tax=Onchocerca ochengi TaxID=42157 RepID=A0A182EEJ8_ONCOC|nr:unnamed protein product [Onchocerca ochengi]
MVQSTAVRGRFICGEEPTAGVRVKLFELDFDLPNAYSQPTANDDCMPSKVCTDPDDKLCATHPNTNGTFETNATQGNLPN